MNGLWEVIREFTELSEVLIFIFLILNVKITKNKRNKIVVVMLAALIVLLRTVFLHDVYDNRILIYEVFDFLIIWNIIDLPFKRKIIIYLFAYIGIGNINIIIVWIFSQLIGVDTGEFLSYEYNRVLIYLMISFIMIMIRALQKHEKNKKRIVIPTKSYVVFLLILIPSVYYAGRIFYIDINDLPDVQVLFSYVKILLLVAIIFTGTLGIVILAEERKADKEKIFFQDELIELQKMHYNEMKVKQQELREVRHDMKAHFMQITQLYNSGSLDEFESYLKKLEVHWDYSRHIMIETGNYTADIIISYYVNLAKTEKVNFICRGYFLDELLIDEYDLCSLLFNGVSNAYEECKRLKDKDGFVQITIKNFNKVLFLTISNTYREESKAVGEWMTSKKDKDNHGYGVRIIKKIVDKYGGKVSYSTQKCILNLEIMLPNIYQ